VLASSIEEDDTMRTLALLALACLAPAMAACSDDDDGSQFDGARGGAGPGSGAAGGDSSAAGFVGSGGAGSGSGPGSGSGADNSGFCGSTFTGIVRDFQASHPDFEFLVEVDPGIVEDTLGADGKPVYAGQADNPTTNGQEAFDQWYRDVDGVNIALPLPITLTEGAGGVYTYDNGNFFPIDGEGFGDEGNAHNYHFTYELRAQFLYQGGEVFSFTGDDDLFTFVNGHLAIDLGGVHGAMSEEIDLDAQAATLGIEPGNVYPLDFFFAERHTSESNFRIDTTISFVDCGEVPD
jgi:fibro-slime domain-containing protein